MITNTKALSKPEIWVTLVVFFAYAIGTLSVQHYLPSPADFMPNITVIGILCVGMLALLTFIKVKVIGLDSIFWLLLFILVLIQPFFITSIYLDGLIFPLATLLVCFILSAIVNNISDMQKVIQYSAYGFITVGVINFLPQMAQYLNLDSRLSFIMALPAHSARFYGNVAQPNQLAFIYTLAIPACYFLYNKAESIKRVVLLMVLVTLSIGVALTGSRGGVVLLLASLFFYLFSFKRETGFAKVFVPVVIAIGTGYSLGLYLLNIYTIPAANAFTRISAASSSVRVDQIQQAWIQFQHHPIIGVGFGNLLADSIEHIEEINWFVFSTHSHNLIAQIAAEFGMFGLALFLLPVYIIMTGYLQSRSVEMTFVLVCLLVVGLYSFSEYPLWFPRFLVIAVLLLSIINNKKIKVNMNINFLFGTLTLLMAIGSGYYYYQYQSYNRVNSFLINYDYTNIENMSDIEKQEFADIQAKMVRDLDPIFGFSDYKELYIYYLLPEDNNQLNERIELGNRVLTKFLSRDLMQKQALYLGLNNQSQEALYLYKGACLLNHSKSCDIVTDHVNELANQYKEFNKIRQVYNIWDRNERQ